MRTDQHLDDPALAAWRVQAADYPRGGPLHDRLRFLVRYAVLAPSSHNSQPWAFRIETPAGAPGRLEVRADRSRGLAVVDTTDRELVMSVGAALEHLVVAACAFGLDPKVETIRGPRRRSDADPSGKAPGGHDPSGDHDHDLLAVLHVADPGTDGPPPHIQERAAGDDPDLDLFDAIPHRRTTRRPFEDRPLPGHLLDRLAHEARRFDVSAAVITGDGRRPIADLVAEGDRRQMADASFRRELASWIRFNHSVRRDGMRGYGFGIPTVLSAVGPLVIRTFDRGDQQAAQDEALAQGAPALVLLATETDDDAAWMASGRALARVLLALTAGGATASYLNQPLEVSDLRAQVAEQLDVPGHPQLLLRVGYGPDVPAEPRRWLEEVVLD
jgi:hypothetical protein